MPSVQTQVRWAAFASFTLVALFGTAGQGSGGANAAAANTSDAELVARVGGSVGQIQRAPVLQDATFLAARNLLELSGSGFGDDRSALTVYEDGRRLPGSRIRSFSDTRIQLVPPAKRVRSYPVELAGRASSVVEVSAVK